MRYLVGLICLLALPLTGCSETAGMGGSAGAAGGAGTGGEGGGRPPACIEPPKAICVSGPISPIEPCCELPAPPEVPDACIGNESLLNPTSCTATGDVVTHQLTLFEVLNDCDAGYDLDGCSGQSCINGGLASGEGALGTDNALAGLYSLRGLGGDGLGGLNQVFSDGLCGLTERSPDVPGCEAEIPSFDVRFLLDINLQESCARVTVLEGETPTGNAILNLTEPNAGGGICASGKLGTIPTSSLSPGPSSLENVVVRMTLSESGFSGGVMGATADQVLIWEVFVWAIISGAADPGGAHTFSDINADLSGDNESPCNALSGTYRIGGVALR